MPPVTQRRLLARAPNFSKTEAGVKALVSVFLLFSSSLSVFVGDTLAPKPHLLRGSTYGRLPLLSCLAQSLPLAPAVNLTCVKAKLWFKLTAGPLLRGIQAVLQELAGSATGDAETACRTLTRGALRAWLPTRHPSCIGSCAGRPAQLKIGRARWHRIWCANRHAQEDTGVG